jgi:hypothetical protein
MPSSILRGIAPPFQKQLELIEYLFKSAPDEVKMVDLVCGRGFGKSVLSIVIATLALSRGPNEVGLFLEPDWKRINRVFLKKWLKIVPPELYKINKGEQRIEWVNGALLFYGPRNVTGSYSGADDAQLGQDTTFIIDDEAALRCSATMYINNLATIREHSPARFYLTATTPRVGAYQDLVTSKGHKLFRGHSSDSPYLPRNYVENLRARMGPEQAKRELDGEFISLEGKIWKYADIDTAWPNGNRHDQFRKFDPNRLWWLFCDLGGATGAYVCVQQTEARYNGRELFRDPVWVAVADYCPRDDASASRAFQVMRKHFGRPVAVTAGKDVGTHSSTDGKTVSYFAEQIWPGVHIYPCDEHVSAKQIQYDCMSSLFYRGSGERRFCVAKDFFEIDAESRRGVRQMVNTDHWPDENQRRMTDFLPKQRDNRVQHVRDALLMGTTIMSPPDWRGNDDPAG